MICKPGEDGPVTVWAIYREPQDYPGRWVLRGHEVFPGHGLRAHSFCFLADSLDEARAKVPAGAKRFGRSPEDHPAIHECWMDEAYAAREQGDGDVSQFGIARRSRPFFLP
jgi:hypothetical protein